MSAGAAFQDQAVVVTGAGSGIGFGICRAFAGAGARVALSDVDGSLARDAAAHLNAELGRDLVTAYAVDVSDVGAQDAMLADFVARTGRLDVAVANAGVTVYQDFFKFTPESFDRIVAINLRGTFFLAQRAARTMVDRGTRGRIVLISSVLGALAIKNTSVYSMTKAGIQMLAKSLGLELGRLGVTVNAVAPGATLTERTAQETGDYATEWGDVAATGKVADVDDIAGAVLYLASPGGRQVNGQTLFVDGGWTGVGRVPPAYL